MKTLELTVTIVTIEDEQIKKVTAKISDSEDGTETITKSFSYNPETDNEVIKTGISTKLTADGFVFDTVIIQ